MTTTDCAAQHSRNFVDHPERDETAPERLSLLVAIPCFNEEKSIAEVVANVPRRMAGIGTVTVLVVDDGSAECNAFIVNGCIYTAYVQSLLSKHSDLFTGWFYDNELRITEL